MIINPTWWRFQTFFSGVWYFRTSRGCSPNHQMKPWKRENGKWGKCISFTSGKNGNCGLDKSLSLQPPTSSYPVISYHLSLWDVWCINVIASDVSHHQITNWRLFIPSKSIFPNNFSHVWQAWSSLHQIVIWICFWYNLSNSKVNEQKSFHNILPLWLSSFSWRSPRCACSCLVVVTVVPSDIDMATAMMVMKVTMVVMGFTIYIFEFVSLPIFIFSAANPHSAGDWGQPSRLPCPVSVQCWWLC